MYNTTPLFATNESSSIKNAFLLFVVTALVFFMTACGDSSTGPENGNGNGQLAENEVGMGPTTFSPANLTVEVGTTVRWINTSDVGHTVTSGTGGTPDELFNSGNMAPGDDFEYTFTEAGTYPYYCIPHVNQGMSGTITVVE